MANVAAKLRLDVLVVDDDERVREVIHEQLKEHYSVRTVGGVDEAIVSIYRQTPDVIVTDFGMPERSGAELLRFVAHQFPDVLRVLHSGFRPQDLCKSVTVLADAVIPKTGNGDTLRSELWELVRMRFGTPDSCVATLDETAFISR